MEEKKNEEIIEKTENKKEEEKQEEVKEEKVEEEKKEEEKEEKIDKEKVEETKKDEEEKEDETDTIWEDLKEIEKYIEKLSNKEDIKLYIDLVDKWLNPDKAFDTLTKIIEKEKPKPEEPKVEEVKSVDDIIDEYL